MRRCQNAGVSPTGESSPCDGSLGVDAIGLDRRGLMDLLGAVQYDRRRRDFDLHGVDLSTADLRGASLRRVDLRCANLRMATISISIAWSDLRWADLRGASLRKARLSASDFRYADLRDCDLRYAEFDVAQGLEGWDGCDLRGANFDGADLRDATYRAETIWPANFDPVAAGAIPI